MEYLRKGLPGRQAPQLTREGLERPQAESSSLLQAWRIRTGSSLQHPGPSPARPRGAPGAPAMRRPGPTIPPRAGGAARPALLPLRPAARGAPSPARRGRGAAPGLCPAWFPGSRLCQGLPCPEEPAFLPRAWGGRGPPGGRLSSKPSTRARSPPRRQVSGAGLGAPRAPPHLRRGRGGPSGGSAARRGPPGGRRRRGPAAHGRGRRRGWALRPAPGEVSGRRPSGASLRSQRALAAMHPGSRPRRGLAALTRRAGAAPARRLAASAGRGGGADRYSLGGEGATPHSPLLRQGGGKDPGQGRVRRVGRRRTCSGAAAVRLPWVTRAGAGGGEGGRRERARAAVGAGRGPYSAHACGPSP